MGAQAFSRARRLTLATWGLLLLVLAAWQRPQGDAGSGVMALGLLGLPLCLPLVGLWRGLRRSYRWAPLTLAPVVAWSLTEILAHPAARPWAVTCGLLAFLALAAVVATLRVMPGPG